MKLIVTRPPAQAGGWVQQLRALGCEAEALPLIRIEALADDAALRALWRRLADFDLVMFVSANAVQHFLAAAPGPWPARVLAGSTGPGTTAALDSAGVPPAQRVEPPPDAGRFDSEALWQQLRHSSWAGRSALIVRGEDGRDWLADTLRAAGARVELAAAYRRLPPTPDAAESALLAQALATPASHLWLFSSSEAVRHLRALAPQADWGAAQAVASHPRIAQAARDAGFGRVGVAPPSPAAVAACARGWPSIQSGAP